jgi:hypothetical protein
MPYFVDFKNSKTKEMIASNPIATNLGEEEIIKMAKETLIEDKVATEAQLKSMTAQIRIEKA